MGTLDDQRPRVDQVEYQTTDVESYVEEAKVYAEKYSISFSEAIEIIHKVEQCNLIAHQINDLDVKDEQLAGFGALFQELIQVIRDAKIEHTN